MRDFWEASILHSLIGLCLWLWLTGGAGAAGTRQAEAVAEAEASPLQQTAQVLQQNLDQERLALQQVLDEAEERARAWDAEAQALRGVEIDPERLSEAQLALESASVRVEMAGLDGTALEQEISRLQQQLAELDEAPGRAPGGTEPLGPGPEVADVERRRQEMEAVLGVLTDLAALVQQRRKALTQLQELAAARVEVMQAAYAQQVRATEQERLEVLEQRLNARRTDWLAQAAKWREALGQLEKDSGEPERIALLETRIRAADEQAQMVQMELQLARLKHRLLPDLEIALPADDFDDRIAALDEGLQQLESWNALLERRRRLLLQQQELVQRRESLGGADATGEQQQRILAETAKVIAEVQQLLTDAKSRLAKVRSSLEAAYRESLRTSLTRRTALPSGEAEWQRLQEDLTAWPEQARQRLTRAAQAASERLQHAAGARWINWGLFSLLWIAAWRRVGLGAIQYSYKTTGVSHENIFSARTLAGLSAWWLRNRRGLLGWGLAAIAGWTLAGGELAAVASILAGYWLWVRLIGGLSYMLLASQLVDEDLRQPRLHRALNNLAAVGGLLGALLLLGEAGFIPQSVSVLVERLLLAFLLLPGVFLLRTRGQLVSYANENMTKANWREMVQLLSFAIPMVFLAAGVLGFAGYLNLGWRVAGHLAWFIGVLFGWLILRGLLQDLTNYSKGLVNEHTSRGLLWAQEVIDPLHRLLRFGMFIGVLFILFKIYGWTDDADIAAVVQSWLSLPVLEVGGFRLLLKQILWGLVVLVVVFRMGGWIRQITYRWIFQGIADIGIRNSLAVFTQYTVVLVGLLAALNALGLDLTSLAVFAGALGVGIGFGLQTIANNFISGIILLAERPLRAGDWVTVAANTGHVSRIGIRSVTVTTWDNQDVIIPNSEFVSHAFVNWTHTNNVVRTKVMIRVGYESDPHRVQHILEQVIGNHPWVVDEPGPAVWLYEYGDSSVDFWVHFYTDVIEHGYLEVRSQMLMAIWDALRENGVKIPYPQRDIHIRDLPQQPAGGLIMGT